MAHDNAGLGGAYNNAIVDDVKSYAKDTVEMLRADLFADGYPPGTRPIPKAEQLQKLQHLRATGDPSALTPQAQREYERLAREVWGT